MAAKGGRTPGSAFPVAGERTGVVQALAVALDGSEWLLGLMQSARRHGGEEERLPIHGERLVSHRRRNDSDRDTLRRS